MKKPCDFVNTLQSWAPERGFFSPILIINQCVASSNIVSIDWIIQRVRTSKESTSIQQIITPADFSGSSSLSAGVHKIYLNISNIWRSFREYCLKASIITLAGAEVTAAQKFNHSIHNQLRNRLSWCMGTSTSASLLLDCIHYCSVFKDTEATDQRGVKTHFSNKSWNNLFSSQKQQMTGRTLCLTNYLFSRYFSGIYALIN